MQVYRKSLLAVEVLCREPERKKLREQIQAMGYRVVADRPDRYAGTGAFADDLWYLKGERKVTEEGFALLSDVPDETPSGAPRKENHS